MIQIQDNGCGIRKEDLGIVCERFTTSKLTDFEDLKSISTFGFRGEALASITHVAHVTITTKTASSPCAYKGKYSDGKMVPLKNGQAGGPKPCAGVNGTTILVEDLFYNMKTRRNAFKNTSEQYQRTLEVITRYAVHYGDSHIAFTCRKHGQAIPDLHTPSTNSSTLGNIKLAYGQSLARELIKLEFSFDFDTDDNQLVTAESKVLPCHISGFISNANYSMKRGTYIFFINHRLVECSAIKKLCESYYADILPKTGYPFIYLALNLPPHIVDVNIHPTKKEVCFLFESQILQKIYENLATALLDANESRAFPTQTVLSYKTQCDNDTENIERAKALAVKINPDKPRMSENSGIVNDVDTDSLSSSNYEAVDLSKKRKHEDIVKDFDSSQFDSPKQITSDETLSKIIEHDEQVNDEHSVDSNVRQHKNFRSSEESDTFDQEPSSSSKMKSKRGHSSISFPRAVAPPPPNKLVRTDPNLSRIDQFFSSSKRTATLRSNDGESAGIMNDEKDSLNSDKCNDKIASSTTLPISAGLPTKVSTVISRSGCQRAEIGTFCQPVGSCPCCSAQFSNSGISVEAKKKQDDNVASEDMPGKFSVRLEPIKETTCKFLSIIELITEIKSTSHTGLENIINQFAYVGVVDHIYMIGQVLYL